MCGLCGVLNFKKEKPVDVNQFSFMLNSIISRGPDESGEFINGHIALGSRRLSIVDIATGKQPISSEDNSVIIVMNGEIYNYRELQKDLSGHRFKTDSDTEVALHLYEDHGIDFVTKLNGMFAIAIWDSNKNKLILARDRIGKKPLYYSISNDSIIFASEIKAILKYDKTKKDLDLRSLYHYLIFNYVPAPGSIYANIKKMMPATLMVIEKDITYYKRYWQIKETEYYDYSKSEYKEKLEELLKDSVKKRLIGDIPVGAFLSGGLDSSCICAIYSKLNSIPIKTFTVGFKENSYNESKYAEEVAKLLKTEHYSYYIDDKNIKNDFENIINYFDEPFADGSSIPVYYISKLAAKQVKVVLTGDGADEIFGGYDTYGASLLQKRFYPFFKYFGKPMQYLIDMIPASDKKISFDYKLKRFIKYSRLEPLRSAALWRAIFDEDEHSHLISSEKILKYFKSLNNTLIYEKTGKNIYFKDAKNKLLYLDLMAYLPEDMLVKVDRMTMMNSLEARCPFLDYRLIERSFTIPSKYKFNTFARKIILKDIMKDKIPENILNRKKEGFNIPIPIWIMTHFKDMIKDIFFTKTFLDIFNRTYLEKLLKDHYTKNTDNSYQIYNLLVFGLWHQKQIKS